PIIAVLRLERGEIEPVDRLTDRPNQMIRRKPLAHVRRQQKRLLPRPGQKPLLAHPTLHLDDLIEERVGPRPDGLPELRNSHCSLLYVRSLEDYAFASLFGESIAVSENLPGVRDTTPGAALAGRNSRVVPIERFGQIPTVGELILRDGFRTTVGAD